MQCFGCEEAPPLEAMRDDYQVKDLGMSDSKLRRQNGILGGVCSGLGVFFGINPLWFRLLFLLLLLPGGLPGLIPYIVLWIVIPKR
jgi:phage shock protein C